MRCTPYLTWAGRPLASLAEAGYLALKGFRQRTRTMAGDAARALAGAVVYERRWEGGGWAPTEGKLQGVRPGTRPLTAGEVVENWDEVLGPRCFARWRSEDADFQLADIDNAVAAAARVEIRSVSNAP